MTEVFITNIQSPVQADKVETALRENFPGLKINFDINETELIFPCGHSVLRVEGPAYHSDEIITALIRWGFDCQILEDKICI